MQKTRSATLLIGTLGLASVVTGCGHGAGASPAATHAPGRSPTPTEVATVAVPASPAETSTATPVSAPPTDVPTADPTPIATHVHLPPTLVSLTVSPQVLSPGQALLVSAHTAGDVSRTVLLLSSGPAAFNQSYRLARNGAGAWTASIDAPAAGTYHYSLALFDATGRSHVADNDGWNVSVRNAAVTPTTAVGVPQTIPDDIPLVPPFNFSNPAAATFSAEGQNVQGAEVVSDRRPDISAQVVAQWYENRFPRAGWTVDVQSEPPAGATSFTMSASSGGRVCVVSYSGGVVHVFYTVPVG